MKKRHEGGLLWMDLKKKFDGEQIFIEAKGDSYTFLLEKGEEDGLGAGFMKKLESLREKNK